jgi:hypothetical protein
MIRTFVLDVHSRFYDYFGNYLHLPSTMKTSKTRATLPPFEKCNTDQLKKRFGLQRQRTLPSLTAWLTTEVKPLDEHTKLVVTDLQEFLLNNIDYWNEEELKFKFIGPLVSVIRFDSEEYSAFLDRKLSAEMGEEKIVGIVDLMVATGKVEPQEPFFFLHEYKKERGADNEPLGQLLIAMYAAQTLNINKHTLYGTYIVGRNWFLWYSKEVITR